jgi:hypothetical protein
VTLEPLLTPLEVIAILKLGEVRRKTEEEPEKAQKPLEQLRMQAFYDLIRVRETTAKGKNGKAKSRKRKLGPRLEVVRIGKYIRVRPEALRKFLEANST